MSGLSVDGTGVSGFVLFVSCLVAAAHGCFVGAFVCAMVCVVRGNAPPLLLSSCNTAKRLQAHPCIDFLCLC